MTHGCIDPYEVESIPGKLDRKLVVDGKIHSGKGPYFVSLEWTDEFGLGAIDPVLEAELWIYDGLGNREMAQNLGEGIYQFPGTIVKGEQGREYWIELAVEGKSYESSIEKIPPIVPISEISFREFRKEGFTTANVITLTPFMSLSLESAIPDWESGPYLRWEVEETYTTNDVRNDELIICYYTLPLNPQNIQIVDGSGFLNPTLVLDPIADREIDWTFNLRHVFSVYQFSITEEAFQYWRRLQEVINQTGGIFDKPPAPVRGNIRNILDPGEIVLGYFGAESIDTLRLTTFSSDFRFGSVPPRCPFNPSGVLPPQCRPCWELENVFFERPFYFDN
ncbi:MAG: DUF4249 domain-containing protein [Bacteroidota bacterium]